MAKGMRNLFQFLNFIFKFFKNGFKKEGRFQVGSTDLVPIITETWGTGVEYQPQLDICNGMYELHMKKIKEFSS